MLGFCAFFASDCLLALQVYAPEMHTGFNSVMITYYAAQYLIYLASTFRNDVH